MCVKFYFLHFFKVLHLDLWLEQKKINEAEAFIVPNTDRIKEGCSV